MQWEKYFEQGTEAFAEGNFEQADAMLKAALAVAERLDDKLILAMSADRLGELYFETQHYQEAEPLFIQALQIRESMLSEFDDLVVASLNNLSAL